MHYDRRIPQLALIEQMRRVSLRHLLFIVFLNAVVRSVMAALSNGARAPAQTAFAAAVALTIAGVALARAERLESDLARLPCLPTLGACLGAAALVLDAPASSTMFTTMLVPVGLYAMYAYWGWSLLAAAIVIGAYIAASTHGGIDASLETVLGGPIAALTVIVGGLVPVRVALATLDARAASVATWHSDAPVAATTPALARPGISREHDAKILAGVLAGKSDKVIAFELGMGSASWRVRYRRRRLESEHGVSNRRELAKLLHERADADRA